MNSSNKMGRPLDWIGPWRDLQDRAGGVMELAKLLHVSRRTLERLKDRPVDAVPFRDKMLVNQIAEQLGVMSPFASSKTMRVVKKAG